MAAAVLELLGGADNIVDVTNCVTRLRVNVKDETLVADDPDFKSIGTSGIAKNGKACRSSSASRCPRSAIASKLFSKGWQTPGSDALRLPKHADHHGAARPSTTGHAILVPTGRRTWPRRRPHNR